MPHRKERSAFSAFLYRYRNLVERLFNRLKHFRAVATRYDKRDDNFLASLQLASIRIWLLHNESVTQSANPPRPFNRLKASSTVDPVKTADAERRKCGRRTVVGTVDGEAIVFGIEVYGSPAAGTIPLILSTSAWRRLDWPFIGGNWVSAINNTKHTFSHPIRPTKSRAEIYLTRPPDNLPFRALCGSKERRTMPEAKWPNLRGAKALQNSHGHAP